ncbi:beta-1,3-1,4-glucanase [Pilobolus umbonatus]|nr:beta-1,3-1,4-glucanase [Pilobolus umbonatus]
MKVTSIITLSVLLSTVHGWTVKQSFRGQNFLNGFTFFADKDPSNGFVQYQTEEGARSLNLITETQNNIIIRADANNVTPNGRPSVRLLSKERFKYGLFILDLEHMPFGCGTWPAFWMLGAPVWPTGGQINIIEGINLNTNNKVSLHTTNGCTMENVFQNQTGKIETSNCNTVVSDGGDGRGCAVTSEDPLTYGAEFNANNGGVFATRWTSKRGVQVWFFPRNKIPADITSGQPNPDTWGIPISDYPFVQCNPNKFGDMQIIINLTFCGDWGGSAYPSSGCPSTCAAFVENEFASFNQSYWSINSLTMYQESSVQQRKKETFLVLQQP